MDEAADLPLLRGERWAGAVLDPDGRGAGAADRPRLRGVRGARPVRDLAAGGGPARAAGAAGRLRPGQRHRAGPSAAGVVRRLAGRALGGGHGLGRRHALRAAAAAAGLRQLLPGVGEPRRAPPQPDPGAGGHHRRPARAGHPRRDAGQPGVLPDRHGGRTHRPAAVRHRTVGLVLRRLLARRARRDAVRAGRLRRPGRPRPRPARQHRGRPTLGAARGARHRAVLPAAARQPLHLLRAAGGAGPRRRAARPRRRHRAGGAGSSPGTPASSASSPACSSAVGG